MVSSALMIGIVVVAAVAVVAIVVLVAARRRARRNAQPGIGAVLPSGAVLNPTSSPSGTGTPTRHGSMVAPGPVPPGLAPIPPAPAGLLPPFPTPGAPGGPVDAAAGDVELPREVVELVAAGRQDDAVAALRASTGRDRDWAERVVDGLAKADAAGFLSGGSAAAATDGPAAFTSSSSTTISWSASHSGGASLDGSVSSSRSVSPQVVDELLGLVRRGREEEAVARLRAEVGMDDAGARQVIDTLRRIGDLGGLGPTGGFGR
ncbi:hypothetical protein [Microbacterium resistens]|uniref:hypothetical protein n=1 Tax=Microbacterium resistens TaxID=156977 RepID=UPI003672E478